jgi:hypothetical protein
MGEEYEAETGKPNKLAQAVKLLAFIREVSGSSLGRDTIYFDWIFCGLPQPLQADATAVCR